MIISRTPYRISFFGGGTDYPAWYRENGGAVLSTTIDKFCYISCRCLPPFFDHRIRVVWSRIELARKVDEIIHPAVRETLKYLNCDGDLEIHHDGELPGQSGIGSSSAFTIGLVHALRRLKGESPDNHQLAEDGIEIEQNRMKETVGSQDQVSAAFGGFNRIDFRTNGAIEVQPLAIPGSRIEELNEHLMLFFTGMKRNSSKVAASYAPEIGAKTELLTRTQQFVDEAISILERGDDLSAFGHLLNEGWQTKREFSEWVSNPAIDSLYETARKAGALGGKLLGAGGGGFLLLFARPSEQPRIREVLSGLVHVPFAFESTGSRIIYSDRPWERKEGDISAKVLNVRRSG